MKYYTLLFILFIGFTSCKSSKKAINTSTIVKKMSARKVAKKHMSSNFDEKTIDARLKVNYKDTKDKIGFSVRMKIIKDEVIWLKGTKVINIFKAKITPTKVQFYSSYYKNYFDGDFAMLKKMLGTDINFEQLQNMLLGQSILDVKSQRQEVVIKDQSYQLSPKKQADFFDIFFHVNPNHYKLDKQSIVNQAKNQRLDISYPKYSNKKNVLFPQKIIINAKTKDKFTNINLTTRSVEFNKKLNTDFKIPSGYKEIKL